MPGFVALPLPKRSLPTGLCRAAACMGVPWVSMACVDYGLQDPDAAELEPLQVEERFLQEPLPGLDVLFVVDSTGSMAAEQEAFALGTPAFVEGLDALGVAWQVGVTSTDPVDAGALLGRPWILTSGGPNPAEALAAALRVGTDSPPPSAGLDAAAQVLADVGGLNAGFRRDDAPLHIVFLSDGDDASGAWLGMNAQAAFLALLDDEAARTGRAAVASAVVGNVPDGCEGPAGTVSPGTRYAAVAEQSGGRS